METYRRSELADLGCRVIGVDSSAELVHAAQRLGIDARVGDGERLGFSGEFDAVFTNAALDYSAAHRGDELCEGDTR